MRKIFTPVLSNQWADLPVNKGSAKKKEQIHFKGPSQAIVNA
jgi:hypothetical protein